MFDPSSGTTVCNLFMPACPSFSFAAFSRPPPVRALVRKPGSSGLAAPGSAEESEALFDVSVLVVDLLYIDGPMMHLRLIPPRPLSASPMGLCRLIERGTLWCLQYPLHI